LGVRDIDFERRRIHVREAKGGNPRTVPIDDDTLQDIRFLVGSRRTGRLLRTARSRHTSISVKQINDIVARCGRLAGVNHPNPEQKHLNPHLFRHSFVRNAIARGANIDKIQQILGHASIRTTIDVYGTPSLEAVQDEYEKKIAGMY
jgi:integrase